MNKKGISLIVLVITIIVMIVIAGAIILNINSSNVTAKANLATLLSDRSNYQSTLAVKIAENVGEDGSVDYTKITDTAIFGTKAEVTNGTWKLSEDKNEVIFKMKDSTKATQLYGKDFDTLVASYDWLTK